ncbi:MAG: PAS domain S-box protein, partial [Thermoplasmata archaeon]|nr:PAS domain S-box protein [Thermoplasmata archaeon]
SEKKDNDFYTEERLRELIENISDVLLEIDSEGTFTYISPQLKEDFGYEPEELIGKNSFDQIHLDDLENAMGAMKDAITKGKVLKFEFRTLHKDGHYVPVSCSARMLEVDGDIKIVGVIRDITERRKIEAILRESEEKFRLISENTNDIIAITDLEGTYTYLSPSAEQLGYKVKDLLGRSGFDYVHPDDVDDLIRLLENAIKEPSDEVRDTLQYRFRGKKGDWHRLDSTATLIKDKPGRPGSIIFISRDITERRRMEEELRESEEKFRMILASSPDAITVSDLAGKVIESNQQALELFSFSSAEEAIGRLSFDFIAPEDRERAIKNVERTLKEDTIHNVEYTMLRNDGSRFKGELSASVVRDSSGTPLLFVGITKDITERKRDEELLRESEAKYSAVV